MRVTTISQKTVVPASPDEVYEAYIDARGNSVLMRSKATSDLKVGGKITVWDWYISGKNLELKKIERIVQEWITTEWPKSHSTSKLRLMLKKVKQGTEISRVHSNVRAEQADYLKQGRIDFYWNQLKEYFEK